MSTKDFPTEVYNSILVRDSVYVQDWNGNLYFDENGDNHKVSIHLASLPGHMKYVRFTDSIILVSDMHVLCVA